MSSIVTSIEASLRRLQTDYIDLYYVHARDVLTGVEELMRVAGVYGAQLPGIDDPRAQAVRRTTTGT